MSSTDPKLRRELARANKAHDKLGERLAGIERLLDAQEPRKRRKSKGRRMTPPGGLEVPEGFSGLTERPLIEDLFLDADAELPVPVGSGPGPVNIGARGPVYKVNLREGGGCETHLWDAKIRNAKDSKSPVMADALTGGFLGLHNCHFGGQDDAFVWHVDEERTDQDAPAKWHMHPHCHMDFLIDGCSGTDAQEHVFYFKNVRKLHIMNCHEFGRQGGNWLQVASRRGRTEVPGYTGGHTHGDPRYQPAGKDGWAIVENCSIDGTNIWSRKASEISFFGFLGPIHLRNIEIVNGYSGIVLASDAYKGAWLVGGGHYTTGMGMEDDIDFGLNFTHPYFMMDEILIDGKGNDNREQVMLSGVKEVDIGSFEITGGKPAIVLHSQYGGPFGVGKATFHDKDSVDRHLGRIVHWDARKGKYQAFTENELQDMMA